MFLAAPDRDMSRSVAVLNESSSDVRIYFYAIEDKSFVIAREDFEVSDSSSEDTSNLLPRNAWKIFSHQGSAETKFCMRVRSSTTQTAANVELGFCTAFLGEGFVVRDPLVSAA
jgi:hypothetical protein